MDYDKNSGGGGFLPGANDVVSPFKPPNEE